ncbi:MAG: hypothetical protein JNL98_09320 [Bryobacterales bacterium]|nr:hypothetical protein [Bryobacterales bacterium]
MECPIGIEFAASLRESYNQRNPASLSHSTEALQALRTVRRAASKVDRQTLRK